MLKRFGRIQHMSLGKEGDWIFADREDKFEQNKGGWLSAIVVVNNGNNDSLIKKKDPSTNIFTKLRISLIELEPKDKLELRKVIWENGGKPLLDFMEGKVDILLMPGETPQGENYDKAKGWGVACIKPEWIHESVKQGRLADIDKFRVLPPIPPRSGGENEELTLPGTMSKVTSCFRRSTNLSPTGSAEYLSSPSPASPKGNPHLPHPKIVPAGEENSDSVEDHEYESIKSFCIEHSIEPMMPLFHTIPSRRSLTLREPCTSTPLKIGVGMNKANSSIQVLLERKQNAVASTRL